MRRRAALTIAGTALCSAMLLTPGLSADKKFFEQYCVIEQEADAFTVLMVHLEAPGVGEKTYRFPIEKRRQRWEDENGQPLEISGCTVSYSFVNADNPFGGTGYGAGVNVTQVSKKGLEVNVSLSWTLYGGKRGSLDEDFFIRWRKPVRRSLSPEVKVRAWFEKPKAEPKTETP